MKKIAVILLVVAMVLALTACGAESTVVLRGDMTDDMGGIPATDTWTLNAKGDVVKSLTEVFELDLSDYDKETRDYFVALFEEYYLEPSEGIDGVECVSRMDGNALILELTVECKGDTVKKAVEARLLEVDGGTDVISLKETRSALEKQGYEVVK